MSVSIDFDASSSSDADGTIVLWYWDFGDSTTGTGETTSHIFADPGATYTVSLTTTDNDGLIDTVSHDVVCGVANVPPAAAFSSSVSYLVANFTNTSSDSDGTIVSQLWDFGDGATSAALNPSHTYASAGAYTVTLTVTDNQGATGTINHNVTVVANVAPTGAFSSSISYLVATFTNTSSDSDGTIVSQLWNFGDGATSSLVSPSHTYAANGTYTVQLIVTDNGGATGAVSHDVIAMADIAPTAAFTHTENALVVSFDATTSSDPDGTIVSWMWVFGNGNTGSGQTTSHTYATPGTFTVQLTVTDDGGLTGTVSDSVTLTVYVYDSFDSYADGSITALNGGTPSSPYSLGTGSMATYPYNYTFDSFDSYANGPILGSAITAFTANQGGSFAAALLTYPFDYTFDSFDSYANGTIAGSAITAYTANGSGTFSAVTLTTYP